MLETVNDSIPNKKISALELVQMPALLQEVLTLNSISLRTRSSETVYPQARGGHKGFEPFLTSTLLAHCHVATAQEVP